MNWFKRNPLRSSFGRRRSETHHGGLTESPHVDPRDSQSNEFAVASFETFHKHWQQLKDIIQQDSVSADEDDVIAVVSHLDHIITLINIEFHSQATAAATNASLVSSACLDFLLRVNLFQEILSWSVGAPRKGLLDLNLAQSMERLITGARSTKSSSQIALLRHPALHKPIQLLLQQLEGTELGSDLEAALVSLCSNVAILITREPSFLDLFFDLAHLESGPRFPLMSILVGGIYKDGRSGQQSRDGLKLCMELARENSFLSQYMALYSPFCPVVATGLSGLYSALPRVLPEDLTEQGLITLNDVSNIPEISAFVTALEFCNDVVGRAPWPVVGQLLNYFYSGFLVPVLGPALFQDALGLSVKALDSSRHVNTMEQILSSTCYLIMCLRRIDQRPLIGIFVQFLLKEKYDGKTIMDILTERLSSTSKLRLATIHLFTALVDLHCEDVMMYLAFKYLLPCSHIMRSQRDSTLELRDFDGSWSAKFLSFVPEACGTPSAGKAGRAVERDDPKSNRIRSWSNNSDSSGNEPHYGRLAFAEDARSTVSKAETLKMDDFQSSSRNGRLLSYLKDMRTRVERSLTATRYWTYPYNGEEPSLWRASRNPEEENEVKMEDVRSSTPTGETRLELSLGDKTPEEFYATAVEELNSILNEISVISPGRSSGYESFNFNLPSMDYTAESDSFLPPDLQRDLEFWSFMRDDDDLDLSKVCTAEAEERSDVFQSSSPSVGPFLDQIVRAVDSWLSNSIQVNLALCGLITSLAAYPQPLLNSYLLNPFLVVQPSIPSLFSCLAQLKQRIDSALYNVEKPSSAIVEARSQLERLAPQPGQAKLKQGEIATSLSGEVKRRGSYLSATLSSLLFKKTSLDSGAVAETPLEDMPNGSGYRYTAKQEEPRPAGGDPIARHVALCAILLEEWLHELAALCLEHAVSFTPMPIPKAQLT